MTKKIFWSSFFIFFLDRIPLAIFFMKCRRHGMYLEFFILLLVMSQEKGNNNVCVMLIDMGI